MNDTLHQSLLSFWETYLPLPAPADLLTPEAPEPEMDFELGQEVIVRGNHMRYDGTVVAVDGYENLVIVRIWDPEIGRYFVGRWSPERVKVAARS